MKTYNHIPGIAFISMAVLILLNSCNSDSYCIRGNGTVSSTKNSFSNPFSEVKTDGSFEIEIFQDSLDFIEIIAETNIIPLIDVFINNNTLFITTNDCFNANHSVVIRIHGTQFNLLEMNGSGTIRGSGIHSDQLRLRLSGSGSITMGVDVGELSVYLLGSGSANLSGKAENGLMEISGSGSINAYSLLQQDCGVSIFGSGSLFLSVESLLDVTISGSGSVNYRGNPEVKTNITGSGSVNKVG